MFYRCHSIFFFTSFKCRNSKMNFNLQMNEIRSSVFLSSLGNEDLILQ